MTRDTFDRFQPRDRGLFGDNESADRRASRGPRVTGASDLKDIEVFQHAKTKTGILVSHGRAGTAPQWINLEDCQVEPIAGRIERIWNDDRRGWAPIVLLTLSERLAREKGLI